MAVPSHRMAARSRQFCSSRTLPGQEWSRSAPLRRLREPKALAAHLARVALRGRPRPGAGCPRGAGAGAGSPPGRRRAGRRGPRGTPCAPPPALRSRLVAATTRTSTVRVCTPPTRSNCLSWTRRRILPCRGRGRSPISSRKRVPRWAISALPTLRPPAPVKAPFSWPKSSFSSRASGMAAQLMATKGPLARGGELVERAAHQLLAGAALAEDEHGGVGGGRPLEGEHRLLEGGILAHDLGQAEAPLVVLLEEHVAR